MGFSDIYSSSCNDGNRDIRILAFNKEIELDHILNPIALIICYFIVAVTSNILLTPKASSLCYCVDKQFFIQHCSQPEESELEGSDESISTTNTNSTDEITEEKKKISFIDHVSFGVNKICSYIYKNSYVFTNILMMVRNSNLLQTKF